MCLISNKGLIKDVKNTLPLLCYVDFPFASHLGVVKSIVSEADAGSKENKDDLNRISKFQQKHGVELEGGCSKRLVVIEYIKNFADIGP